MEKIILRSFVEYQEKINVFLTAFNPKYFSKSGQELLTTILDLRQKEALSLETLSTTHKETNTDYFIDFLGAIPNPNYLNFAPILLDNVRLEKQKEVALKLLEATEFKQILDVEVLFKEAEVKETKVQNLNQWIEFYANKPKSKVYPTQISFLDSCFNGGFELAQLMLISGDPEAGKTRLGLQILENLAKFNKVCFFCFEFTAESYVRSKEKELLAFYENIFVINDGYDISEIARNIKDLYKQGVKFFLIDSQMRITSPQARNMEEEETLKFSTLAKLCHSLNIFIMLIVQTSKSDRDNPMGSKKGGHEASITIRIERIAPKKEDLMQSGNEFDENRRVILIKKNKQTGKHPKEEVFFDTKTLTFKAQDSKDEMIVEYVDDREIKDFIKV